MASVITLHIQLEEIDPPGDRGVDRRGGRRRSDLVRVRLRRQNRMLWLDPPDYRLGDGAPGASRVTVVLRR